MLTTEQIDREISARAEEVGAMSATLVELDAHPGLIHVRSYPPTGVTARQWATVQETLAQLWEDLRRVTSILDSAKVVRARRSKPDDTGRTELTNLLRGRPLEVSRQRIPLGLRHITDPAERVEHVGLADTVDRMRAAFPAVAQFLEAVDQADSLVVAGLAPSQKMLDAAGAAAPKEIAELLVVAANDPLSLTPQELARRVSAITQIAERRADEIAEMAALQANWADSLAETTAHLDALRELTHQAAQVRERTRESVIAGPLPVHTDSEPLLRAELASIAAAPTPDSASLTSLRRRIGEASSVMKEDVEVAQGLLDRRGELKGRLTAYEAKAARVGLGEDRDLLASNRIAVGLLDRRPCDLRAVTRAINDYQQLLHEKQGASR